MKWLAVSKHSVLGMVQPVTPMLAVIMVQSPLVRMMPIVPTLVVSVLIFPDVIVKLTRFKVRRFASKTLGVIGMNTAVSRCVYRNIVPPWIIKWCLVKPMRVVQVITTIFASMRLRLAMRLSVNGNQAR